MKESKIVFNAKKQTVYTGKKGENPGRKVQSPMFLLLLKGFPFIPRRCFQLKGICRTLIHHRWWFLKRFCCRIFEICKNLQMNPMLN